MRKTLVSLLAVLFAATAACGGAGDSTGPAAQLDIRVGFVPANQALLDVGTSGGPAVAAERVPGPRWQTSSSDSVFLQGANGQLVIRGMWGVVSGLQLEESADACDGGGGGCHSFDSPPLVVALPVSGEIAPIASGTVPASTYAGLRFELEDFEVDGPDDEAKSDALAAGLSAIRMNPSFSDWPAEAALLVTGTFTPDGGSPQEYRSYLTVEQLVDHTIQSPIALGTDDDGKDIEIRFSPSSWFVDSETNEVADLSQYDFSATSQVWDLVAEVGADPPAAFIQVILEGEGSALGPV